MIEINELQNRKKLNEGRNFGIGFSILKKITNTKFETYLPFTACKDYLNDFSYVEFEKKEIGEIHGYDHKLLNCFKHKQYFYLGVNTLHYNNDESDWDKKDEASKLLIDNYKNLELFLNSFEISLDLNKRTSIKIVDDSTLLFKVPLYWIKSTPLISVYTLMIRMFFNVTNEELTEPFDVLLSNHKSFISGDTYYLQNIKWFWENLNNYKFDKINYDNLNIKEKSQIHNFGIEGFKKKQQ